MKKLIYTVTIVFLLIFFLSSCNKNDSVSPTGGTGTTIVTQTYSSTPNKTIAPNDWTNDSINANITLGVNAQSLSDIKLNLTNLEGISVSSLRFALVHKGIEVFVIDTPVVVPGTGNMTNTVLSDSGITRISNGTYPFTGTFKPQVPLSNFINSDPSGYWTLKIYNSGSFRTGVIKSWSITITYTPQPTSSWQLIKTFNNNDVRAIDFLDANTGWICSHNNSIFTVYKTVNAGGFWTEIYQNPSFSDKVLYLKFLGPNLGFACGEQGSIYKTTNGGLNWDLQKLPVTADLYQLTFLNPGTGLVCGGEQGLMPPVIFKTIDGGNTWNGGTVNGYSYLECICFADPTTAYAAGDYDILKSVDGGDSWTVLLTHGSAFRGEFPSIQFINQNTGFVAASLDGVLYTSDGGLNWLSRKPNPVFAVRSVFAFDANTVYAAGADTTPYVGKIYKSSNGGLNWIQQLAVPNFWMGYIRFVNANTGFAGGIDVPGNPVQMVLYRTTTGGN